MRAHVHSSSCHFRRRGDSKLAIICLKERKNTGEKQNNTYINSGALNNSLERKVQKLKARSKPKALNVYLSSSEVPVVMLPACLESQAMLSARLKKLVECQQISQARMR